MGEILSHIPLSFATLIGLIGFLFFGNVGLSIAQEWGKSLYNGRKLSGKDKRHDMNGQYGGVERRTDGKKIEIAVAELVEVLTNNNREFAQYVSAQNISQDDLKTKLDHIVRTQKENWRIAWEEEAPAFRERFKKLEQKLGEIQ